jgi:hypothetical protein
MDAEADRAWRRRVAEAARRGAADLAKEDSPQLRQLHDDLVSLAESLTDDDQASSEPDDPRRRAR